MNERVKELLAHRTVAIRLPSGETEYWLTDQIFSAYDSIRCQDRDWVVDAVSDGHERTSHAIVTLRAREPAGSDRRPAGTPSKAV